MSIKTINCMSLVSWCSSVWIGQLSQQKKIIGFSCSDSVLFTTPSSVACYWCFNSISKTKNFCLEIRRNRCAIFNEHQQREEKKNESSKTIESFTLICWTFMYLVSQSCIDIDSDMFVLHLPVHKKYACSMKRAVCVAQ